MDDVLQDFAEIGQADGPRRSLTRPVSDRLAVILQHRRYRDPVERVRQLGALAGFRRVLRLHDGECALGKTSVELPGCHCRTADVPSAMAQGWSGCVECDPAERGPHRLQA